MDEVGDRCLLGDDCLCKIACAEFVAGDERRVHLVGSSLESLCSRWAGTSWCLSRIKEIRKILPLDLVAPIDHVSGELAGAHPAVDGLVVHPDFEGDLVQVERVVRR